MSKAYFSILTSIIFLNGLLFPVSSSAYVIDGSTVTLTAADQGSDNTNLIQGFLNNASYTKIIIQPGTNDTSWIVRPLFFTHDNTEIHLNPDTVIEAKPDGYPNGGDCVLRANNLSNIKVTGDSNSKIIMQKSEYAEMAAAEGRHALDFHSCSNVTVSGVTLADTGGDGIYLGDYDGTGYCSNIVINDVVIDGAGRNAISVISVNGLTINDCILKNTCGEGNIATAGPWAGIDFEPNNNFEILKNIVIDNCTFLNNDNYGFNICAPGLDGSSEEVNIVVKNCTMQGNNKYGIFISSVPASIDDDSSIVFEDCTIKDNKNIGVFVGGKSEGAGTLSFSNCFLKNNCIRSGIASFFIYSYTSTTETGGNIELNNIIIEQPENRTVNYSLQIDGSYYLINNVYGSIYASGGTLFTANATNINVNAQSDSAQSYWKTDEISGSIANDCCNTLNGTLQNYPVWSIGKIGGGLTFDGSDQFLRVPNDTSLNIGNGDFSIALWMQRSDNATTNKRLVCKGADSAADIGYSLNGSNSTLYLQISDGTSRKATSCSIPSLDTWHHVAFSVDRTAAKAKLYLNGICQGQIDISEYDGINISNSRALLIGAASEYGWLAWPGMADDIRVYNRVLTSGEIFEFANSTSAHWSLNDSAADNTGRSDGTLYNNPGWTTGKLGQALALNGISQFAGVNNSSDLNIGETDFSVSLWMQRSDNNTTNKRLIYKGASSTTEMGYALCGSNTTLSLMISNGITRKATSCSIPSLDTWHHVVFTVDRSSGKATLYMNGISQNQVDISDYDGVDISNGINLLIGAANTSGWLAWPGKVDDVRIYKRTLSEEEIEQIYLATP